MKNYLVRARINFNDVEEKNEYGCDTPRKAGQSQWYCTKERYEFLKKHNAVELMGIDEIKEEPKLEAKVVDEDEVKVEVVKPKKTTKKKKVVEK